jgi:hypothetical protein
MLNLEKHISELLSQYDCVIVPNLGGFVANNVSAQINEKTGVFSPPSREIGFNRSLCHNDGLLINHMAKCEGISYEDCQNRLLMHIKALKFQLSQGEVLQIDSVGKLKADSIGNTVFIPGEERFLSLESFGLGTFHFNTLDQEKQQKENTRRLVRRTFQSRSVRQVAASVAIMLGLIFVSPELDNGVMHNSYSNVLPEFEMVLGIDKAAATETVQEPAEEEPTIIKNDIEEAEVEVEEVVAPVKNTYFIIGGSFKYRNQADEFIAKLTTKGVSGTDVLSSSNGRFRVSLAGFVDKQQAVEALELFRKKHGLTSAWLLSQQ